MSNPTPNAKSFNTGPDTDARAGVPIEPAADGAPKEVADELFAHGLLTYLNTDTPARQGERIGRLMAAMERDSGDARAAGGAGVHVHERSRFRFPIRSARGWLALAACLTIGTVAVFIGIPGEQSAQAVVQQSIDAMRATAGGDRRYEIRIARRVEDALPSLPGAIIDTRSPNLLLLRANAPDGHEIIAGRDPTGDWAIRMDGGIERAHPEIAWPRWAKVGDESLFVDSVDRLLEELTKSYDLQKEGTAKIEGKGDASYRHIVGTKKRVRSPGGDHVEVWIDATTKSVERLEMRWDVLPQKNGPDGGEGGPAPGGERAGPAEGPDGMRPNRGRPDGPGGDPMRQRPPRRDGENGGGPNGPGPNGPRPDNGDGPRDRRPPRDSGDRMGLPPGGPNDRGVDGEPSADRGPRGPGIDGPHPRPEPRPEGGPPPRNGDGTRGGDRGEGMPPRGGAGPRGPGPGVRAIPPRILVMQRVEVPALEAAWFTPEAHVGKE